MLFKTVVKRYYHTVITSIVWPLFPVRYCRFYALSPTLKNKAFHSNLAKQHWQFHFIELIGMQKTTRICDTSKFYSYKIHVDRSWHEKCVDWPCTKIQNTEKQPGVQINLKTVKRKLESVHSVAWTSCNSLIPIDNLHLRHGNPSVRLGEILREAACWTLDLILLGSIEICIG